ncbi:MAG: hypothetical protein IAF38_21130 [Bacteroidia bacterium]|nr:hypothetical protein [Bacteroidia bacterium]
MKNLKRALRLFGLGLLIVLASVGIGIGGAVPISSNRKRENTNETKIELVETRDDKTKAEEEKIFRN